MKIQESTGFMEINFFVLLGKHAFTLCHSFFILLSSHKLKTYCKYFNFANLRKRMENPQLRGRQL